MCILSFLLYIIFLETQKKPKQNGKVAAKQEEEGDLLIVYCSTSYFKCVHALILKKKSVDEENWRYSIVQYLSHKNC